MGRELHYIVRYFVEDRSIARIHNSSQPINMAATCMFLQHLENTNEAINQEVFVHLRDHVRQSLDLCIKPCDDFVDGAPLPGIW
jgi:hypothetical protein